jgi:hypothetical protein
MNIKTITEAEAHIKRLTPVTEVYDMGCETQRKWKARVEADLAKDPSIAIYNVHCDGHHPNLISVWRSRPTMANAETRYRSIPTNR